MYFREVTEEQARARNLLISIAKGLHNEDEIGGRYMIDEINCRVALAWSSDNITQTLTSVTKTCP